MVRHAINRMVANVRRNARRKRRAIFLSHFSLTTNTTILDVGSEDGSYLHSIIKDSAVNPRNVTIADIAETPLLNGQDRFGFNVCLLSESGQLPFDNNAFDIVFSNSAIEHVTIPKEQVWLLRSHQAFIEAARKRQREFASEIRRVGHSYYIQTPNRGFFIESHTWLPGIGWLPRPILLKVLEISNRWWIKQTAPDWALLSKHDLQEFFPDAYIASEKMCLMTKSIIAIKTSSTM